MKKNLSSLVAILPLSLLLPACGTGLVQKSLNEITSESALLEIADESEESVADHVEDVASELALEDAPSTVSAMSLGLASTKNSSVDKSCVASENSLTVKKSKSLDKDKQRTTKKGRIEKSIDHESSFVRVYTVPTGGALPIKCETAQGPVKILKDKIAEFDALSMSSESSRSHSIVVRKDGEILQSRKSQSSGSRATQFSAASLQDGKLSLNKSVSINVSSQIQSISQGVEKNESHSYATLPEAPLSIEVVRDAESEKLISKTIKSGHVKIERPSGAKLDVIYEMVKFSEACKPVSGRLQVIKLEAGESSPKNLSIQFKDGEAFVSKNGEPEKKMESLNFRLESCRAK